MWFSNIIEADEFTPRQPGQDTSYQSHGRKILIYYLFHSRTNHLSVQNDSRQCVIISNTIKETSFFLFTTLQAKRADVHVALYRTQLNFAFAVTAAVAVTRATAAWTANELKISFGQLSYCSAYHIFFHSYNSSPSSKSRHSLDRSQLET